jgi:hypothetical protein
MSARSARKARQSRRDVERAQAAEADAGYEDAARGELFEMTVAGDETLGSMVDGLVQAERIAAKAAGWRTEQVYGLLKYAEANIPVVTSHGMRAWDRKRTAQRVAVSEVAAALRIPERTALGLLEESRMLIERLPLTMAGLLAGDFSYRHAKAVVDHARSLPEGLQAEFEEAVVPSAGKLTFSKFDLKARTARERLDATTIRERHKKSLADRETFFEPARDGMGWLHLYSSATVTLGAYNRADETARDLQGPAEKRTLAQLRADVVADLLLDGTVGDRPEFGIRPSVVVTVPALAMLGHNGTDGNKDGETELPVLEGYGPIDVDTARRLAGAATSWLRVLTHPETGVTLSVSRQRYKVPKDLRAWLQRRDGTCRKPGCSRTATRCDIDHTAEWQHGGQTAHDNLAHLCAVHHAEKHHTGAKVVQLPGGDIEWTLPSGRTYISEPANRYVPPADPEGRATRNGNTDAA